MAAPHPEEVVARADVELLLSVVHERYLNLDLDKSNALVLALEGLRWLVGDESSVTRAELEAEDAYWQQHSIMPRPEER